MNILIRVLNKSDDEVEVSWQSSQAIESFRILSKKFLENYLENWEVFAFKNSSRFINSFQEISNNTHHSYKPVSNQIERELSQKSKTLSSLLFGGIWKKGMILPNQLKEVDSFQFITDKEWTGLPFEILSCDSDEFHPIALEYPVRRSIRSRNLPKSGKNGTGGILWFQRGEDEKINRSLESERIHLELLWDKSKIEYNTFNLQTFPTNLLLQKLNHCKYLHFAGHTEHDFFPLKGNEKFYWKELSNLDLSNIKLSLFNSCYSSVQNQKSSGLIENLLEAGVENFVGFSTVIDTKKAESISVAFWEKYLSNHSLDKTLLQIRVRMQKEWGYNDITPFILHHFSQAIESESKALQESSNSEIQLRSNLLISILFIFLILSIGFLGFFNYFNLNFKKYDLFISLDPKDKKTILLPSKTKSDTNESHTEIYEPKDKKNSQKNQNAKYALQKSKVSDQKHNFSGAIINKETNPLTNHDPQLNLYQLINELESKEFKEKVIDFLETPNTIYTNHEKFRMVEKILVNRHESEELRQWKFQKLTQ